MKETAERIGHLETAVAALEKRLKALEPKEDKKEKTAETPKAKIWDDK